MTSAPVRDPVGGHLLTPGKRSAPAHRLPALAAGPRCAGRPATPPRNARREASGRQHEASARDSVNTEKGVVNVMPDAISGDSARDRRWLILGVIGLAQLMVVLDITVMNIALPSAQRALGFTTVERQWVVTAYTLAFGSLLLPGGRLADLLGRKTTFLAGLAGFAVVSFTGGALLLARQPSPVKPRLDIPGALLVSGAVVCLVYGFSTAATHHWAAPSTYGFLAAGVAPGAVFALWQGRAAHPLLPP